MDHLPARMRALALPLAIAIALPPVQGHAGTRPHTGEAVPTDQATALPSVKVVASTPSIELDVPGTVSVITRLQMDRQLDTTIRDLVRYEPGVSVTGSAGRFGLDSFNIRGLSGNRSYMEIDGVPMASSFGANLAGGSFRAGRDYIDLDAIKRVKILRGPISALYPSSALGGAVILTTRDPADYLREGRKIHVSVKEQYDGTDRSFSTSATLASGDHHNGLLVNIHHRHGHETGNRGDTGGVGKTRTRPDPMTYDLDSLLGKYVHTADGDRRDRVTLDMSRRRTRTYGLSQLTANAYTGIVPTYYRARDTGTRLRASFGQSFPRLASPLADALNWHAYWQKSRTRTDTRTDAGDVARYFRTVPLTERILGIKLLATKHLDGATATHTIRYGMSASRTRDASYADGHGVNKLTGARGSTRPFLPGDYPMHLIPQSDTWRHAVFGQDEIELLDGCLKLIPGLRVAHYAYKPGKDRLYLALNPGYRSRNHVENHVSPKLGVIWHVDDALAVYADYADGFRPPLYSDISGAWNEQPVPGFNIAFLPNPNLEAETSDNVEIGVRGRGSAGWFNVAAYYNRYRDFIWSGHPLPPDQVPSWASQISPGAFFNLFFRAVNAQRAYIKGIEASGRLRLGAFSDALHGWSVRASAAIASGGVIEPGNDFYSPLDTVDPAKLVAGIDYEAATWGFQLVGTAVRRHTRLSDPSAFRPAGYGVLDFYAHWNPGPQVTLYFGATNLTDRKYWDWGNLNSGMLGNLLSGNGVNDAGTGGLPADRLSMPGRAFSAAIKLAF